VLKQYPEHQLIICGRPGLEIELPRLLVHLLLTKSGMGGHSAKIKIFAVRA